MLFSIETLTGVEEGRNECVSNELAEKEDEKGFFGFGDIPDVDDLRVLYYVIKVMSTNGTTAPSWGNGIKYSQNIAGDMNPFNNIISTKNQASLLKFAILLPQ